jgi:hypothetical protein
MPRRISVLVGIAAVALAIGIAAKAFHASKPVGSLGADRGGDSGTVDDAGTLAPSRLPSVGTGRGQVDDLAAPPGDAFRADSAVGTFADGTPVPPLPRSAPHQVRFGVVLVSYAGAQPEASGARPATRSHADAKALAEKLAAAAAQDFHAVVQQGDTGSADDIGSVKIGILEPAAEYVLFTLPVYGIGGPVDTPRGYWVVKRLE